MSLDYQYTVAERLMRYVQIDTQSDPHSESFPSTEKQKHLGRVLVEELKAMGAVDVQMDEWGYVFATIPPTVNKPVPVICFCAHMDTSPDCSGTGVKPLLHRQYDGGDIVLPDDPSVVISPKQHPYLLKKVGEDIITASGTTLLGADDKAGVAVIMDLAAYLISHPSVPHGKIRLLFTPDEEIGKGVDKLDMKKLGADFGYTLDGGERGALEYENFSADGATVIFHGISAHPGDAKDKMVSALKVASHFIDSLPKDELAPEATEGRYGFVHPVQMQGTVEKATVEFILRDHHTPKLPAYQEYLKDKILETLKRFPGANAEFSAREQYRNMIEVLDQHPQVVEFAREAMLEAGIEPISEPIRGGTDGARLSYMGLPCPNIFTGEMALHGKYEYVSVQDMQKSVETLVNLVQICAKRSEAGE
ncbi:MAG: peptidase T [Chitinophagaceae bacterium]|nr:peptidase T [Chitinophagaceae bacterium]